MKIKVHKESILYGNYQCVSCRSVVMRTILLDEPTDTLPWAEVDKKSPKCGLCKKQTRLYWLVARGPEEVK